IFFFQAADGIRAFHVTGVQTCALPILIAMDEHPATAVRKKRNSSIVVANRLVKEGEAGAVVSAGNTGAAMAASLLTLGRIPGIEIGRASCRGRGERWVGVVRVDSRRAS